MDNVFRALADETRRRIIALVWSEEMSAGDIAERFSMTRPAISQHLRVLLDADLLSVRSQGTRRYYRARAQTIAMARQTLDQFWADRLARLKSLVEGEDAARPGTPPHDSEET